MKTSTSFPLGELSRSISMSPEHVSNVSKLTLNTKEAKTSSEADSASDGVEYSITPTELMDPIFETRRSSAGSILPFTDVTDSSLKMEPDFSAETSDRFYLLKKDSQRREYLVKVLQMDKMMVIDSWHHRLNDDHSKNPLTKVRSSLVRYK